MTRSRGAADSRLRQTGTIVALAGSLWRSRGCARGQVRSCSLRRAGGRESTSRPLGGCAAESVRPRKARKEIRARTPLPRRGDLDDITADSRPAPLSRHPRSALPLELPYTPASACRYLVFETARKEKCQLSFARGPRSARCSLRSAHAAF